MGASLAFWGIGFLLHALAIVFTPLSLLIPVQVAYSLAYLYGYLAYFMGIFPVDTLTVVLVLYVTFRALMLLASWILTIFAMLPLFGRGFHAMRQNIR